MRSFISGGQIKEDEVGGACSTHGGDEECKTFVGKPERKTLKTYV
jgi:hypothetical protein